MNRPAALSFVLRAMLGVVAAFGAGLFVAHVIRPPDAGKSANPFAPSPAASAEDPVVSGTTADASGVLERALQQYLRAGRDRSSRGLWLAANEASADEARRSLPLVLEISERHLRFRLLEELVERWAQSAPEAALAWAEQLGNSQLRSTAVRSVIDAWAESAPEAAARYVAQLREPGLREFAIRGLIEHWPDHDSAGAVAWVTQLPEGTAKREAADTLAKKLIDRDAALAFRLAFEQRRPADRNRLVVDLLTSVARDDLGAALGWIERIPPTIDRTQALEAVTRALANDDPTLGAAFALTLPAGRPRNEALRVALRTFAESDASAALGWLRENISDPHARGNLAVPVLKELAQSQPERAAQHLALLTGQAREDAIQEIGRQWIERDAITAARWSAQLPPTLARRSIIQQAVTTWADQDRSAALTFLTMLPDPGNHPNAWQNLGARWAEKDRGALPTAFAQIANDDARSAFANGAARQRMEYDPVLAATLFTEVRKAEHRGELASSIASYWSKTDPAAASAWAISLPGDEGRHALRSTAQTWSLDAPAATWAWSNSLPEGPARDSAIQGFAQGTEPNDPLAAARAAGSITDPKRRENTLRGIARAWLQRDRAAAEAWLPASGLSEEEQQLILYTVPKH